MWFGGSRGSISLDGVTLQHSKSCSDWKRFQEDEFRSIRKEFHTQKRGDVESKSQSRWGMKESSRKNSEYLEQEVLHLEKLLETQTNLRQALESCLGYNTSSKDYIETTSLPDSAVELIEDIVELKSEVAELEKYLSSLYRKGSFQKVPPSLPSAKSCHKEFGQPEVSSQYDNVDVKSRDLKDHTISNSISKLKFSRQSFLPQSLTKLVQNTSEISLAKRLGTRFRDFLSETPNRLSEDMINCMSAIYCKLSKQPLPLFGLSSRSFRSLSRSLSSPLDHSGNIEGLLESNGPYSRLLEVSSIYRDNEKLAEVEYLLQDYRYIVSRLEKVDPAKLTHEEKIAFWINIHNSLVMNAFVAFGIPNNNLQRSMYIRKAAYNIGGHSINADIIQSSILRCRMSHHRQGIKKLFPLRSTLKIGDEIQAYAIAIPEPHLYFTLSTGCYSDPAVHAFTPMEIYHELETAKNEYIRATLGILKNKNIFLPKLVESFSRDSNIPQDKVLNAILQSLPEYFRKYVYQCLSNSKSPTAIEWVPHNFSFRYLISKELAKNSKTHRSNNN